MALQNYNDLIDAIPRWLNKRTLDGMAGDFITLCETDLEAKLRSRQMQVTVDAPVSCAAVNLPPDWLDATRLWMDGATRNLDFVTPDAIEEVRLRTYPDAVPVAYTLIDNAIELAPAPQTEMLLHMSYYARVPRLTVDAPTNWLTIRDIGVYLYGALVVASPYLIDDERVAVWGKQYDQRVASLNASSQVALHSGAPLTRRRRGYGSGVVRLPWNRVA